MSVIVDPQAEGVSGCCPSPNLVWTPYFDLPEPIITCTHCGFRLDPDGILLDWLDPEEIERARILEENTPHILELAARLGLIGEAGASDQAEGDERGVIHQCKPRPEDILSGEEAELLQRADREEIPCPRCETPLSGEKVIIEDLYEGIVLTCAGCGFVEY